jgi:hypothetical protein
MGGKIMPKTNPKGIKITKDGGLIIHPAADTSEGSSIRIPQASTDLGAGFGDEITDVDRKFAAEREPVAHFLTYLMSADVFDKWFIIDDPSTEEGDPKVDEAVQDALTELKAKEVLTKLLEYERIYGYSLLVGSFNDVSDVKELETPLNEGSQLLQLDAYSKPKIQVWTKDIDANSERFGEPIVYKVERGDGAYLYVHYTRCYRLQTRSSGKGVLDPIWDDLTCGRNIRWGASQWMYRTGGGFPVIKFPPGTTKEKLEEWIDSNAFANLMSRTYIGITGDMDFKFEGAMGRALDPTPFFHTNLEEISKGTGVPEPVLRGAQAGAVTGSEVNQRQYFKVVSSIQVSLEELVRWVIDHLAEARQIKGLPYLADESLPNKVKRWIKHDVQPKPQVFKYEVEWVSAFELTELDEKQSQLLHEQANQIRLQYMTIDEVRQMNELDPLNTPETSTIQKAQPFQVPFEGEGDSYLVTEVNKRSKSNKSSEGQQDSHIH